MFNKYSAEFKEQAVKRVLAGEAAAKVARDLGINVNSLYTWKSRYVEHPQQPFVGSGHLRDEDAEIRRLHKEIKDLKEENEFLKKAASAKKAGIIRRVSSHACRHSFASHLFESGVDIKYIQSLLGHVDPRSTDVYLHVSNKTLLGIRSPFDVSEGGRS